MDNEDRACRICMKLSDRDTLTCGDSVCGIDAGSICLSKDRAMIVLLDTILKELKK